MYKVLICDDEKEIRDLLKIYMRNQDIDITEADNGALALELIRNNDFDLALIDIMMPYVNGLDVIKEVRKTKDLPVLIISARTSLDDRLTGYEAGADDYITKPFEPLEVLAKIKARLKKPEVSDEILKGHGYILDTLKCTVERDGQVHDLTSVEFSVLKLLMGEPGRVFTKEQIYMAGWNEEFCADENTIRVMINRLRNKIGNENIETVRGLGYRLRR